VLFHPDSWSRFFSLSIGSWGVSLAPTSASALNGRASVLDGDTLEIKGTRIRLHGIDAP
jgi:endonuclease YncB( thermonuclease family)